MELLKIKLFVNVNGIIKSNTEMFNVTLNAKDNYIK